MIDRKKVIKGLEMCIEDAGCNGCPYKDECYSKDRCEQFSEPMMRDALALLKEQEAKQGKWERQYSRPGVYANLFWWCSVCGEPTRYNDAGIFYQYCPHCGAKIDACKET